jgi:murein DD-endopeptidase MepM/ murein hydrolase activator NlpD
LKRWLVLLAMAVAVFGSACDAPAGGSASARSGETKLVRSQLVDAVSKGGGDEPARTGLYRVPVAGEIVDPFRPPSGPFGAGNRGVEIRTGPGDPVVAPAGGVVAFAGAVGTSLVVSIDHSEGLRTTLTGLAAVEVSRGDRVEGGEMVARAGDRVHVGLRAGGAYIDPSIMWLPSTPALHSRLVPLPGVKS